MSEIARLLSRAEEDLGAAASLKRDDYLPQAVSRCYYAVFYAAEAALLALGEIRSKHSGVISAFQRLVVKEGGMSREMGDVLRRLFEDRNEADYGPAPVPPEEADQAIKDATAFVAAVREWLAARGPGDLSPT